MTGKLNLSGQIITMTGHCPLTGCYFEPSDDDDVDDDSQFLKCFYLV